MNQTINSQDIKYKIISRTTKTHSNRKPDMFFSQEKLVYNVKYTSLNVKQFSMLTYNKTADNQIKFSGIA